MSAGLSIDEDRLYDSLAELGRIGEYEDGATGLIGVRRLALSDEDRAARDRVVERMNELGLEVRVDAIGNILGRRAGRDDSLAPVRQTARTDVVPFAESVQAVISQAAQRRGLRHQSLFAGAGHDAQEWASRCPAAMIFVPGEHDGISHNPRELSTPRQCADGINVLLDTVTTLAEEA